MEPAVDPVHVITANDLLLRKVAERQDTLVATAGDANHSLILDIEIEGLLTPHPDYDREIKCHERTSVVQLVDMSRLELNEFPLVRNLVPSARYDELSASYKMHSFRVKGARDDNFDFRVVFEHGFQTPQMINVLVANKKEFNLFVGKHLIDALSFKTCLHVVVVPTRVHKEFVMSTVQRLQINQR